MTDYSILQQEIINDLQQNVQVKTNLKMLRQKINSKTATYTDAGDFSKVFGDAVSKSIQMHTAEGVEAEFLKEFSEKLLAPIYRECQKTMIAAGTAIQKGINDKAGIGLNPAEVITDESRISNLIQRFAEAASYEDVAFLTNKNTARSITRGAVNDCIKTNAKLYSNTGLKVLISRSDGAGCCDWCASVTGTFKSFEALPDGFWGIHRGCSCVIDYRVGKTKSRISFKTDEKGYLSKITEESEYGYPYGENAINVDLENIHSEEYKKMFDNITNNMSVNESIYKNAVTLLEDNTGTKHEDLCIIDLIDGTLLGKETSTKRNSGVVYSEEIQQLLNVCKDNNTRIVGMHNHPQGTPPSGNDFRKAYENQYEFGLVIGHNGLIYKFETPDNPISKELADQITENIAVLTNGGIDVDRASKEVYDYYNLTYKLVKGE